MKYKGQIEVLARGVLVQNGQLLVCHTHGAANTYLPGGHVEFEEGAKEALRREVEEELGWKVMVGRFLGVAEHTFNQKGKRHCEVNLIFEMQARHAATGAQPASCEGHLDFRWLPLSRLGQTDLEPAPLRRVLRAWLRRNAGMERWTSTI